VGTGRQVDVNRVFELVREMIGIPAPEVHGPVFSSTYEFLSNYLGKNIGTGKIIVNQAVASAHGRAAAQLARQAVMSRGSGGLDDAGAELTIKKLADIQRRGGKPVVPLEETEYARDGALAYTHSDLARWADERSGGDEDRQQNDGGRALAAREEADGGRAAQRGEREELPGLKASRGRGAHRRCARRALIRSRQTGRRPSPSFATISRRLRPRRSRSSRRSGTGRATPSG